MCLLKTRFLLLRLMLSPLPDTLSPMTSVLAALLLMMRSSVRSRAALQLEVLACGTNCVCLIDLGAGVFASRASTAYSASGCRGFGIIGDQHS